MFVRNAPILPLRLNRLFTASPVATVDDQDSFMQQGTLRCPKCVTTLRHIGVDYDRPLEKYRCLSCNARFIEATVLARCYECGQSSKPDDLVMTPIHEYRIGKLTHHIAREGSQRLHLPLAWGAPMAIEHFPWLLQWSNACYSVTAAAIRCSLYRLSIWPSFEQNWGC